ncbi:MAG: TRAP transporter small permease subunit [bacterium]|nr:TRAP transporter small permease subunit [bacterium]
MHRFIHASDQLLTWFLIALIIVMVGSITAEILLNALVQPASSSLLAAMDTRAVATNNPGRALVESSMALVAALSSPINTASQTLLVWIGILGSALAFRHRAHLGVDALVLRYPPRLRLWLDYLSTTLVGLFSLCVFCLGGYQVCAQAFRSGSKMPGIEALNHGWFYLVLLLTGLLNLLYCVYHFAHPRPAGEAIQEED